MYSEARKGPSYINVPVAIKMSHIGHQKHLCYLAESGDCSLDDIKLLVKDSKFICRVCGRTAAAEENLYEPIPLYVTPLPFIFSF